MPRTKRTAVKTTGGSPGTLVHVGDKKSDRVQLSLVQYDAETLTERPLTGIGEARDLARPAAATWINIDGIHDTALMAQVGTLFGIHPLTLEDVLNTTLRPKAESFTDYLFIALKRLHYDPSSGQVVSEQISLILTEHLLLSFQEAADDLFEPVRERIRKGKPQIRTGGCDYLAYALIDAVVDGYFLILDQLGERIEALEETIDAPRESSPTVLGEIHAVRREMIQLRKQVWPLREAIAHLRQEDLSFMGGHTALFLRDVSDHIFQVVDAVETYRDILAGLQDLYLSTLSNRMNEVMKVLTMIATIFIPITFVAGIYGMNFHHMPELGWRWGYPLAWGIMVAMAAAMLWFFKRKKWW